MSRVIICLFALLMPSLASAYKRVAVLPLKNLAKVDPSAVVTLTDAIRTAALGRLPDTHFKVMSQVNVTEFTDGKTLAQCKAGSKCELETARKMNLDYFVVGKLTRMDELLYLNVEAWDAESASVKSSFQVSGKRAGDLMKAMGPRLTQVFAKIRRSAGVRNTGSGRRIESKRPGEMVNTAPQDEWADEETEQAVVQFVSEPSGATLLINGRLQGSKTPTSGTYGVGERLMVSMQMAKDYSTERA